jgi:hypothetical protein
MPAATDPQTTASDTRAIWITKSEILYLLLFLPDEIVAGVGSDSVVLGASVGSDILTSRSVERIWLWFQGVCH